MLYCPESIVEFCQYYNKKCPNFCSLNGYCFNEKCVCRENWSGDDCNQCLGVLLNGVCTKGACPKGYYLSRNIECRQCEIGCM